MGKMPEAQNFLIPPRKFSRCDIVIYCGCYGRIYTFIVRTDVQTMSTYTAFRVYASFKVVISGNYKNLNKITKI